MHMVLISSELYLETFPGVEETDGKNIHASINTELSYYLHLHIAKRKITICWSTQHSVLLML